MTISDIFHLKTLENDFFFNIPGAVILSPGCSPETDLADERKKKIAMLQTERKAHSGKDADLFISEFADR